MNLVDELYAITAALTAAGIRYAVCGGVAVTLHGATRSTKDIDLLISPVDVQRDILENGVRSAVHAELFLQSADAQNDRPLPDALKPRGDFRSELAVIGNIECV